MNESLVREKKTAPVSRDGLTNHEKRRYYNLTIFKISDLSLVNT